MEVIIGQREMYGALKKGVDEAIKALDQQRRSANFHVTSLVEPIRKGLDEVKADLDKKKTDHPDMAKRDPIYLSGGVVWAAATFAHPADAKPFTALTLKDVEQLESRLTATPDVFPEPDFSVIPAGKPRQRATAEWEKVKKVYPPAQLLAGLQVLKGVYREVGEEKHYLFARNGNLGWILAYVTESAAATN